MRHFLLALGVLLPLPASAASASTSPLDAAAAVPALDYRSAFAGYRPFDDVEAKPWREVNDRARDVGGHAGVVTTPAHDMRSGPGAATPMRDMPHPSVGKPAR
jgi:hypothetical protein